MKFYKDILKNKKYILIMLAMLRFKSYVAEAICFHAVRLCKKNLFIAMNFVGSIPPLGHPERKRRQPLESKDLTHI